MQLKTLLIAGLMSAFAASCALGQSLTPMRNSGMTPTDVKGFRVQVGNPYQQRMVFALVPMEPGFEVPALDAVARPNRVILAPGHATSVIFAFKISPEQKERTIALCVHPENLEGSVLPRVCGTYVGHLAGAGG